MFKPCVFLGTVALAALLGWPGGLSAGGFVQGTEDVPLMAGLEPLRGASLEFDAPGGRLMETYARGPLSAADVLGFYRRTLPQLGWHAVGNQSFVRESERLDIEFTGAAPDLIVRFSLSPRG